MRRERLGEKLDLLRPATQIVVEFGVRTQVLQTSSRSAV